MLKRSVIAALAALSLLLGNSSLAVLEFTGENISDRHLEQLAKTLRTELMQYDTLAVMDGGEMRQELANHGIESPPCFDHDCAVVAGLLLETDFVVSVNLSKVGDVFVFLGRLYDLDTGRIINTVTYDHEYSIDGLLTVGLKNAALMLLSQRIPIPAHEQEDYVYIVSNPDGASVRVGRKVLDGTTPLALDRVTVESQRITIIKEAYHHYVIRGFPKNETSRIIQVKLSPLDPTAFQGHLKFSSPMPDSIYLTSDDGETSLLIPEGAEEMTALEKGSYTLNSDRYVIREGSVKIHPRKTSFLDPTLIRRDTIEKKMNKHRFKRNIYFFTSLSFFTGRGYLEYSADKNYDLYLADPEKPASLRETIIKQDKAKPWAAGIGTVLIIPALYHQLKIIGFSRLLRGLN